METVALTWTLLFFCFLGFATTEEEVIQVNVTVGENATLPCKAPNNNNIITVVELSRPDLEPECVFLYRDEWIDAHSQNPIFRDRVDLQDKQMKNGNVSVILQNVMKKDTGRYECHVVQANTKRRKRDFAPTSIIYLRVVDPPGQPGGTTEDGGKEDGVSRAYPGPVAGISVMFLLVAVMSLIVISKTHKKEKSPLPAPPDKEAEQQLV